MLAPVGIAAAASVGDTSGPSGDPMNLTRFIYSGNKVGLEWENGDATASTEIWRSEYMPTPPSDPSYVKTESPGVTVTETGDYESEGWYYFARHVKNGQYSDWCGEELS